MSAAAKVGGREQLRRVLASRRCRDLDHAPPRSPRIPGLEATCNRCLAWADRRVDELERAGLIRTAADSANAAAIAEAERLLRSYRWRTVAAVRTAALVGLALVVRAGVRRWPAR